LIFVAITLAVVAADFAFICPTSNNQDYVAYTTDENLDNIQATVSWPSGGQQSIWAVADPNGYLWNIVQSSNTYTLYYIDPYEYMTRALCQFPSGFYGNMGNNPKMFWDDDYIVLTTWTTSNSWQQSYVQLTAYALNYTGNATCQLMPLSNTTVNNVQLTSAAAAYDPATKTVYGNALVTVDNQPGYSYLVVPFSGENGVSYTKMYLPGTTLPSSIGLLYDGKNDRFIMSSQYSNNTVFGFSLANFKPRTSPVPLFTAPCSTSNNCWSAQMTNDPEGQRLYTTTNSYYNGYYTNWIDYMNYNGTGRVNYKLPFTNNGYYSCSPMYFVPSQL
jgi:hypothetical protein